MKNKNLCLHCDPYPSNANHFSEKLEILFSPIIIIFSSFEQVLQKFPRFHRALNKIIFNGFFKILLTFKILKEVEALNSDEELYNRSLVIVREARKRKITIKAIKFFRN